MLPAKVTAALVALALAIVIVCQIGANHAG